MLAVLAVLAVLAIETLEERDGGPSDLRRHSASLRYDGDFAYGGVRHTPHYDCISGASSTYFLLVGVYLFDEL